MSKNYNSMDDFKRTLWRSWFMASIPMLGDVSPIEAAKTTQGRQKLEELLNQYDKFRSTMPTSDSSERIDGNPPSDWVKWKLKLNGAALDGEIRFSEYEKIYNGDDGKAALALNDDTLGEYKMSKISCNVCMKENKDDIQVCSRCKSRRYCSRECQTKDWSDHKKLCRVSYLPTAAGGNTTQSNQKKSFKKLPQFERWQSLKESTTQNVCYLNTS